ncbi:hypothetical protein VIBHAR_01971 [Vibrio campbellii ATCC BAA-1116]|uniref:Uncharacterized protein n=1 Tax=Vibrio campbellii (strain ATCC BAA-1116) TaxID=2902295 RepID=A7MWB3_VIBC1|nr:hypothetical protein VIBHAR_01971 [Vibrio campbellii ATCC BAA-1116]
MPKLALAPLAQMARRLVVAWSRLLGYFLMEMYTA